jgi:ankyrin repeat protein
MIESYFTKSRTYFPLRNYKFETVFHIAAKHNSLEAIKYLTSKTAFFEELIKKDYKGDTPIHTAIKNGSYETLEFYLKRVTGKFLTI